MFPRRLPALAMLLGVLVFLPMFGHPFFQDDFGWIERTIHALPHPELWFTTARGVDFRPLPSFSFAMNYSATRLDPRGYHLFDLLLHLVNVTLLMALVRRLSGGSAWAAGVAGILFAGAVGNYGEAVYWISARTGPLSDAFVLAALIAHWDRLEGTSPSGPALFCFALALLAKETAVVLVPLLVLLEWARARKVSWGRIAPFVLVLIGYLAFEFFLWRGKDRIAGTGFELGPHVWRNLSEYLVRMFLPVTPDSAIVHAPDAALPALRAVFQWGGIALLLAGASLLTRRDVPRTWKFALLWIPVAILPVCFLTMRTTTRYLYLPSMGLAAFVAMAWADAWERRPPRRRLLAGALVALLAMQVVVMEIVLARRGALARAEAPQQIERLRGIAAQAGKPSGQ
jgi:hypothetical protein